MIAKTKTISLRLDFEEFSAIDKQAAKEKVSRSAWIRKRLHLEEFINVNTL